MLMKDVSFRNDLYPRIETDPLTVQAYAEDLSVLPPIIVNQNNELIDGWHRWTAYKKNKADEIPSIVILTKSDNHLLELAIEYNSTHGLQLCQDDKKAMARRIYHVTDSKDRSIKKEYLSKILSVSPRLINTWLSRIDRDFKKERNKRIFSMWLACYSQEEIANVCGCPRKTANDVILAKNADLQNSPNSVINHNDEAFNIPLYNIWKNQKKSKGSKHFGNTEPMFIDRLLYLYTKPLDIVIDPFAGGGSTIDICRKRCRRYFVSDLNPILEREKDIRQLDILKGLPKITIWKDVKLVYLDPPYWKQAEGKYSDMPNDFGNMALESFNLNLKKVVLSFYKKLSKGSYIAIIMQPTQWNAPNKEYTDHIVDIIMAVKKPIDIRVSCPYESQQANAQMTEWAKENKKLLVLNRELIVWRV